MKRKIGDERDREMKRGDEIDMIVKNIKLCIGKANLFSANYNCKKNLKLMKVHKVHDKNF